MSKIVELDVAQATLGELIAGLGPNEEVVIVQNQKPVAKLVPSGVSGPVRIPGLMKGKLTVIVEDDEHLEGFRDYIP